MTRRKAREIVMQLLYEAGFYGEEERERIFYDRMKAVEEEAGEKEQEKLKNAISFMETIYFGVFSHLEQINKVIEENAQHWSFARIARVDLSLLQMAVYEIQFTDVPPKVAVNEALEIAKIYSTEKSPKFINGILGSVIGNQEA